MFSIIFGLVCSKPVEEKDMSETNINTTIEQAFRQAEIILNRYFYLMNGETDQLVHALLHILINNPNSFPFVPQRALDIAFKNFAKKLGDHDVDIFAKPLLLSLEQNFQEKSNQPAVHLSPEVKGKIEEALDQFFEEHV